MKERIKGYLIKNNVKKFAANSLFGKMKVCGKDKVSFMTAVFSLEKEGFLKRKKGVFIVAYREKRIEAVIDRMNGTFAFAKTKDGEEFFIPGPYLNGVIAGDSALISPLLKEGEHDSARVKEILSFSERLFSGRVQMLFGRRVVFSKDCGKDPLFIKGDAEEGDMILFKVVSRRGREMKAVVEENYGQDISPEKCAEMYLAEHEIPTEFSTEALNEAKDLVEGGVVISDRVDLRSEKIFTIDSASSKDLDDAVYLEKTEDSYILKVSIADVSYYIRKGSRLDKEAYERGTSIYYADKVIPMLPKEISNGICSLSQGEDRNTFTCEMKVSFDGEILGYRFYKSVINSVVKGVYSEINALIGGFADAETERKYANVKNQLFLMEELYHILAKRREERDVVDFETAESYFIMNDGEVDDIVPRERGISECIIEEFMILANRCAGMFAKEHSLPFIYRVHETPNPQKIEELKETLHLLGIPLSPKSDLSSNKGLKEVFLSVHSTDLAPIIEKQMLRSMAKARYDEKNCGHFGLNLDIYSHFTSPIRRYSDLAIHRIMSDCLEKGAERAKKKHVLFSADAADRSSVTERRAVTAERDIDDKYRAAFAFRHIGDEAEGVISGVTNNGFFVLLDNTLEGFVSLNELGRFNLVGGIKLEAFDRSRSFKVGDKVKIKIAGADVFSGKTDFCLL